MKVLKKAKVTLETFYEHFKHFSDETYVDVRLDYTYDDNEMTPPTLNDPIISQEIMKCINKLKIIKAQEVI